MALVIHSPTNARADKAALYKVWRSPWLAKETQVDLAGSIALLMQRMPHLQVFYDMKPCNQIVKHAYLYRDFHNTIRSIHINHVAVRVSGDAARGNALDENGQADNVK